MATITTTTTAATAATTTTTTATAATTRVISENMPVRIVSTFAVDGSTSDFVTFARYSVCAGVGYTVEYTEYGGDDDGIGYEGCRVCVAATEDAISVERSGGVSDGVLMLEYGRKHYCNYGTPYGQLNVGVTVGQLAITLSEDGGEIYTEYTLDLNGSLLSQVGLRIVIGGGAVDGK